MPWIVTRLPADYFSHGQRTSHEPTDNKAPSGIILILAKNVFGAVLLLLGIIMLLTPGQGLLTILAGLMLMNFPGKYRLERWVVTRPGVLRSLNWLRSRRGVPPFSMH
jgi:hypothetical protein